jgi:hypothetical protein
LFGIKSALEDFIEMSFASVCFIGTGLVNGYYMLNTLDQILIYFAERCGNKEIQRLYSFVAEMRSMHIVLLEMNQDTYTNLLAWKMKVNDGERDDLSILLHAIFDERMSEKEYVELQADVNTSEQIIKNRSLITPSKVIRSYFEVFADDQKRLHPGLHRRLNCTLFSHCRKEEQDSDLESGKERRPST